MPFKWTNAEFYLIDEKGNKLKLVDPITIKEVVEDKAHNDILGYGPFDWHDEFTATITTSNKRAIMLWRRMAKKRYKRGRIFACKAMWSMKAYMHNHPIVFDEFIGRED